MLAGPYYFFDVSLILPAARYGLDAGIWKVFRYGLQVIRAVERM